MLKFHDPNDLSMVFVVPTECIHINGGCKSKFGLNTDFCQIVFGFGLYYFKIKLYLDLGCRDHRDLPRQCWKNPLLRSRSGFKYG